MAASGLAAFEASKQQRLRNVTLTAHACVVPNDLATALNAPVGTRNVFDDAPPACLRSILRSIFSAKALAKPQRRIDPTAMPSASPRRLPQMQFENP